MNYLAHAHVNASQDWLEKPQHILIVDDEARMRSSLRLLLNGAGRVISECETGREAITSLKTQEIDVVLLDINLPDMSGLEIMEWIATSKIPASVIIVSADDSFESAVRAMRGGAVEFVRKAGEVEEIQNKVDYTLYRRRLERNNMVITARLEQSERLHRFLVENSPALIYTLDANGCFTFANSRVESLLGYTRDELLGCQYTTIIHDEDVNVARFAFTERRRDSRATRNLEVRLKRKDSDTENTAVVAVLSAMGIYDGKEGEVEAHAMRFIGTYGVAYDITERKLAEETISFQALHDQLTALPNRRLFKDRLELAMIQAQRNGRAVGVMFIDLDRFKLVNDTYGHAEGDELLKKVAQRLHKCLRAGDTLARQGGDEFTVLLPDLAHQEDAALIAEKILQELTLSFCVAGKGFRATASIGLAVYPRDGETAGQLLKHADIAMYEVKASGKNGYRFFTPAMNTNYHERISLENELRQAMENAEFELYYQPQVKVSTNRVVGLEALIRWRHPVHGLLNPGKFIDLAEEIGLISSITDWVLAEACRQLAIWRSQGLTDLRISVNVSPQEFKHGDVVERITANVVRYQLPMEALEVEITENLLVEDVSNVIRKIRQLREHGVRISIDDFGTRYSSLNYLRMFQINTIKIDQSFVHDLFGEKDPSPILHAIIGIAQGLGLNLIAEGIETECQMKALYELGCDEMQGYLFSRPVPAAEVEKLLREEYFDIPALTLDEVV